MKRWMGVAGAGQGLWSERAPFFHGQTRISVVRGGTALNLFFRGQGFSAESGLAWVWYALPCPILEDQILEVLAGGEGR